MSQTTFIYFGIALSICLALAGTALAMIADALDRKEHRHA